MILNIKYKRRKISKNTQKISQTINTIKIYSNK